MSLSNNVKTLRKSKELTQKELAKISGVSQTGISMIEIGQKKSPGIDVVKKLADALQVTVDELIKGDK